MSEKGTELRAQRPADRAACWQGWPVNDVLIRHRLLALDRRYLFALPNITVGRVTREIVHELRQIAVDYEELLKGGLSVSAHFIERAVRGKIGDALGSAAWACEALQDPEQARAHFLAAVAVYTRAGATEKARRCLTELHRLNFYGMGDVPAASTGARQAAR
jgi:hypothetical protein